MYHTSELHKMQNFPFVLSVIKFEKFLFQQITSSEWQTVSNKYHITVSSEVSSICLPSSANTRIGCLGGADVTASDFRSSGRWVAGSIPGGPYQIT